MSWLLDWQALSARIQGLLDAGSFFFGTEIGSREDYRSVKRKVLLQSANILFTDLKSCMLNYESILPTAAHDSLDRFLNDPAVQDTDFNASGRGEALGNVQFALTSLAAFQSEFAYLIADTQFIARRITERAFIHLQRSIMVDDEVRKKWNVAFEKGERQCERLGAVHLLSHGVWAFKAGTIGGQTDLVLNEPLPPLSIIESAADALVLTEWKVVRTKEELNAKIEEARRQAAIYSSGVLGGIQIANYRYLVMVSERKMKMPDNRLEEAITYRHINIAVNPKDPSVEARTN